MNKELTIIIPTLNEEKYIGDCLHSVFSQTYPPQLIEVFVIDGGSSDKTIEIVKKIQEGRNNLYLFHNMKKIQSAAFNIGVEKAKGEIIFRLDAHCLYNPDYIQLCVMNHSEGEYGNVGGGITVLPGSDTMMAKAIALLNNSLFGIGGADFRVGVQKKLVETVPFGAFPKKVVSLVGKMNEDLIRGEDNEYNSRILQTGYKILFDPLINTQYYSRGSLKLFLKQMFNNGYSIGILIRKSFKSVSIRHIIPLLFVVFLVFGLILAFNFPILRIIFLSTVSLYFILDIVFGIMAAAKKELKIAPYLIYAVFFVHIYYGFGTITGLWKGKYEIN